MPAWFEDNRHFGAISDGLRKVGFDEAEVAGLMGGNWYRFFSESFGPA
jgi:microsomal dipeptidase-like Zn-dependent dipeptidase